MAAYDAPDRVTENGIGTNRLGPADPTLEPHREEADPRPHWMFSAVVVCDNHADPAAPAQQSDRQSGCRAINPLIPLEHLGG
jgi:hypothetical protein